MAIEKGWVISMIQKNDGVDAMKVRKRKENGVCWGVETKILCRMYGISVLEMESISKNVDFQQTNGHRNSNMMTSAVFT
jgi:hypothetical protein